MSDQRFAARILIVDDEEMTCQYIARHLQLEERLDVTCDFAHNAETAVAQLETNPAYDLLFVDLWMPNTDGVLDKEAGIKVLKHAFNLRQSGKGATSPDAITITANSSVQTALETTGLGVYDYISKPIDFAHLMELTHQVLSERAGCDKDSMPQTTVIGNEIIGQSQDMIEVMKKVGRIANSESDVLIYGETGTGKDLIAQAIHRYSPRCHGSFIIVNCSAIPAEMLESELFGIGRRVATSVDQRQGKFEQANGGSIFLDEIGDLSLEMQPKLLRVLDYKEIQGVGQETRQVDVRVIAATNRNLAQAVEEGQFRQDLFYRLNFMIELPPLRDRPTDILLLAEHFLKKYASSQRNSAKNLAFSAQVIERLENNDWVGNVRELEKVIEYAIVTCQGSQITVDDLPSWLLNKASYTEIPSVIGGLGQQLATILQQDGIQSATEDFERLFLQHKLAENNWNIRATAKQIGIQRQSLHRKINRLGLTPDTQE